MSAPDRRSVLDIRRTRLAEVSVRLLVNLLGAVNAAMFADASIRFYLQTHRAIGVVLFFEQAWYVAAFLLRRPASVVSTRLSSWLLAAGGTFGGLLLRPQGAHPEWGVQTGLIVQLVGLAVAIGSLVALGRSFGLVAADRGLVTRGPYAVVRNPIYAAYVVIQLGYLLQAMSLRNVAVVVFVTGCNVGRCLAEERVLSASPAYDAYRRSVRWRLVPGLW